jgi:Domain of Unknown Function (DUF928)
MLKTHSKSTIAALALGLSVPLAIVGSILAPAGASMSQKSIDANGRSSWVVSRFNPPDRGAPVTTAGGASRGSCIESLMPTDDKNHYFGLTTAAQPTFYWKVNGTQGQSVYFELQEYTAPTSRQTGETAYKSIYQTEFTLPTTPGVVSFSLPQNLSLEAGKSYKWYVDVDCTNNGDWTSVEGWVERTEPSRYLNSRLQAASVPIDRSKAYAEEGIWFDALNILGQERLKADTPELQANWQTLIQEGDIKLDDTASDPFLAPLLECCSNEASSEQSAALESN